MGTITTEKSPAIAILQTGRLGDLWFTAPLAEHLARQGHSVEVWYNDHYGNPFYFFPYITPRPTALPQPIPSATVPANLINWGFQQLYLRRRLRQLGRRIIWNQVYPFRLSAYLGNKPYPEFWYRHYPEVSFRRAMTTLNSGNEKTILYFASSLTLRVDPKSTLNDWLENNLTILQQHTGYRILYVAPPGAADHPRYETWRGDLNAYQQLIARCGLVYGIITSAHVLGQLLGKPIVACYRNENFQFDTIGDETVRLFPGGTVTVSDLQRLDGATAFSKIV